MPLPTSRLRTTFSALHHRDFRLVWTGALISTSGTWMQTLAQSWVVLQLTGSPLLLGIDAFLATLPMIFFSLLGGVAADRFDRRRLLLASQVLQMVFALALAGLIGFDRVEVWHIFVFSFLTGTVQSLGGPAYQALLPNLVPREDVANAVAMNSIQFNLARVIGPVIAGIALARYGAAICFLINGLSFVAPIVTILLVRSSFTPGKTDRSVMDDIRQGLQYLRASRGLIQLSTFGFFSTLFGIPLVTMLPVVAKDLLSTDARGYSILMASHGIGAVLGGVMVAATSRSGRKGRLAIDFALVFAVLLLAFSFSRSLTLSVALLFGAGAVLIGVISLIMSLVQLQTEEAMRGRVMSMFMLSFRGAMPLGNLLAGWVAETRGVAMALGINAVLLGICASWYVLRKSEVRSM